MYKPQKLIISHVHMYMHLSRRYTCTCTFTCSLKCALFYINILSKHMQVHVQCNNHNHLYQLIGHFSMVSSCHSFPNGRLHQSRKRGQDINGWVNLTIVQLSVNVYLSLSDVPSEVRDWMGDV